MTNYSNNEIEVSYDADRCIHAGECVKQLPSVFDVAKKPWIDVNGAAVSRIVEVVGRCPSGALSCRVPNQGEAEKDPSIFDIKIVNGGPYLVQGKVRLTDPNGEVVIQENGCALCRCGASKTKPYCDGSHKNQDS